MAAEPLLASKRAADRAERNRAATEKIRSRTDLTAKALAAVGTAAVSAIGYNKLADVYPYGGPDWAVAIIVVGAELMIIAVLHLLRRFSDAGEVIVTWVDLQKTIEDNKLDAEEVKIVRGVYEEMAKLNDVDSLAAYQARAHRYERMADSCECSSRADELRAQADLIANEISSVHTRVAALILKKRAREATSGGKTLKLILLFVIGWYLMAYAADRIESDRNGEVEVAKACADAREAGAKELPAICDKQVPEAQEPVTAAETIDGLVVSAAEARKECRKAARKAKEDLEVACLPSERALAAAKGEGAP